tara:strand:- start:428 stop:1090 length:663 start_codon:yes stop_codon:yes gene_type:complete
MGIGDHDLDEIKKIMSSFQGKIKKCAILGDCNFHYTGGSKKHFKQMFDFEILDTFDIFGNPDYKLDLQKKLGNEFERKYDLIIDPGTLPCIFDVPACLRNVLFMLKNYGVVFHKSNLVGHFGRTFYALSPSFYNEFYRGNNCDILKMGYALKRSGDAWIEMPIGKHYLQYSDGNKLIWGNKGTLTSLIPCDSHIMCVARKKENNEFNSPLPEHYKRTDGK